MPWRAMNAFAKTLLHSSCAAARDGPKMRSPRAWKRSAIPRSSGSSGPTTVRSMRSRAAKRASSSGSAGVDGSDPRHLGDARVAGSADDFADAPLRRQLPRDRMLAATAADHQHFHDAATKCRSAKSLKERNRLEGTGRSAVDGRAALCLESPFTCDSLAHSVGFKGPTEDHGRARIGEWTRRTAGRCSRRVTAKGVFFKLG